MGEIPGGPFVQGLAIGLALAIPVGAIGLLCIRRCLEDGFSVGFATGMGAAVADACYGAVAAFGLTAVSAFLLAWRAELALAGGAVLVWLGVQAWRARPTGPAAVRAAARRPWVAFGQTVVLTIANPQTILTFVAIFAGLGIVAGGDGWMGPSVLVLGVFLGSAAWWLVLAAVTALVLRRRMTDGMVTWINRSAGLLIAGFGVLAIGRGAGLI